MNKLKTIILSVATLAAGFIGVSSVSAWGPENRITYTNENPAPYATFNSITNNAAIGDERNFVRIGEADSTDPYTDEIEIVPGKEYEVYIYFHNDAADNTNASGYGIATATKVASSYPAVVKKDAKGVVTGDITWNYVDLSDKTHDGKVWDEAYVTTKSDSVVLRYKTGSAIIHNSGKANGSVLSDALFSEGGTAIGYNELKGVMPGCAQYSGYITYTLVAESINSELNKQISLDGENWAEEVSAKAGGFVTYKVEFKNTGNATLTNVIFKDSHDEGLSLRTGSTKIYDVNNINGKEIGDIIDLSGYNVGDVAPGALVQVVYQAKITDDVKVCSAFNNTISVSYNGSEQKSDTASVKVSCAPGEVPKKEETPDKIVETGPLEITMAVLVIIAIIGALFYFWRTSHTLKDVEDKVTGKNQEEKPEESTEETENEDK